MTGIDDIVRAAFEQGYRIGRAVGYIETPEPKDSASLTERLEDLERRLIQRAYDKSGGVKTETAKLLGIETSALYYKLEKYGIGTIQKRTPTEAP